MKKLIAVLLPIAFTLTACVTADGVPTAGTSATAGLATAAIRIGVQAKCVTEINNNSYWRTGSRLLTDSKKQEVQTEVCSCVANKATTSVTAADLVIAAMDKTSQATIVSKVVATTLNACVVDTLKLK